MLSLSPHCAAGRSRGFTLVELMVGLAVSSIVILGVASAFVGINASYQNESKIKGAIENARNAEAFLERTVHLAGYGIDPQFGFDFSTANLGALSSLKDNYPATPPAAAAPFSTDDLAFRYRDPAYARRGVSDDTGTKITLDATQAKPLGIAIKAGQKLIVGCPTGGKYAVLRASGDTAADQMTVTTTLVTTMTATVPQCAKEGTDTGAPFVFLLYEVRIRVMQYDNKPYLVAFSSLDDPTNALTPFVPIAVGVENFQVSYVMNRPIPSPPGPAAPAALTPPDNGTNKNWIIPDMLGETALPNPLTVPVPTFQTNFYHVSRYNLHPANIRGVRISMTVRNLTETTLRYPRIALENQQAWGATDGFYRTFVTTTVTTPNMKSRSFFVPAYQTSAPAADSDGPNTGGG